jgi:very-short-patch-repair endonuclease
MSLNRKRELREIAKVVCRELRKNSKQAENILWNAIRNRKLEGRKFLRQHPLFYDITGKESFFVADFYCHEDKLIIELDGGYHKYQLKEDEERTEILNLLGLRVVRFKNEKIFHNLDDVLNEIKNNFEK